MVDEEEILWTWGFNQYFHGELSREILDSISVIFAQTAEKVQ